MEFNCIGGLRTYVGLTQSESSESRSRFLRTEYLGRFRVVDDLDLRDMEARLRSRDAQLRPQRKMCLSVVFRAAEQMLVAEQAGDVHECRSYDEN